MNIGTVAKRSGVSAKTIRYYESVGLLPSVGRRDNGYRDYGEEDLQTLVFIRRARSLGFGMKEVGDLLALWRDSARASADVRALALGHIAEIDHKVAELQRLRGTLYDIVNRCHGDATPDCAIIDALTDLSAK